ncbi:hypothetical protein GOV10_03010 [Candidatus Woesearchaeota archaeon]|nr:hypothetical protein [Candidatus Woesearchaeota archaeon]
MKQEMARPRCDGCKEKIYSDRATGYNQHLGTWHKKCFEKAYNEGKLKLKRKPMCGRCTKTIMHNMDAFRHENPKKGTVSWMHGACIIKQMDEDHKHDRNSSDGHMSPTKRLY